MARVGGWIGGVAALVVAASAGIGPLAAAEERVAERVFLVRDKPGTPAQFRMLVLAGCSDEADGQCKGLAHYLEHLVLVGRNPEHKEIAIRFFPDASSNGTTSMRATTYIHTVPAREAGPKADLEQLFAFYAARLKDFSIREDEAARERNVVLQEHDWRVGSSPFRRFDRRLDRELMPDHPSGLWTIGTRESIQSLTLADAKAFHRNWYAVNNVYFLVKADIDAKDLKEIAERALAGLEAKRLPPRPVARQIELTLERKDYREADAQVERAGVIYKKLVRIEDGEAIEARAARAVLSSYLRSRLPGSPHQALVEVGKLASSTPFVGLDRVAPKTFMLRIGADVAPDVAPQALLAAIGGYVDAMAGSVPSPEQVDRLKRRIADGRANEDQDPAMVYNRLIGWLSNRNAYEEYASWPQRLADVSHADVARTAGLLAGPGRIVTGTMVPAGEDAGK